MRRTLSVLLPIAAVLAAGLGVEAFLRWGGWGVPPVELHARLLRHDPELGWSKVPGARVSYRWHGRRIVETVAADGSRGHSRSAADTDRTVLFLGDSFCEGYLVGDDEVFSSHLEQAAPGTHAVNRGVVGYSTDQQLLLFRQVVERDSPDHTVVLFFDNDVWFNAQILEHRAYKPAFQLTTSGLTLTGVPVPSAPAEIAARPASDAPSRWRVLALLAEAFRQAAPAAPGTAEPVNEFLVYRRDPPPEIDAAWAVTEAILAQFRREAEAEGSTFAVFYVPTVAAVDPTAWAETRRVFNMKESEWDIGLVEKHLAELCARLGIRLISPTDRFRHATQSGAELYYLDDGHWNPVGHQLAAAVIHETLLQDPAAASRPSALP